MLSSDETDGVPFEIHIETLTWKLTGGKFLDGDYIRIERNTTGYFISGRIAGHDWHDEDNEDFFCGDTDELLCFLKRHNLLTILSSETC